MGRHLSKKLYGYFAYKNTEFRYVMHKDSFVFCAKCIRCKMHTRTLIRTGYLVESKRQKKNIMRQTVFNKWNTMKKYTKFYYGCRIRRIEIYTTVKNFSIFILQKFFSLINKYIASTLEQKCCITYEKSLFYILIKITIKVFLYFKNYKT